MSAEVSMPILVRNAPDLSGLRILVIGLGKSGLAAARLAAQHGARVRIADRRSTDELGDLVATATGEGFDIHAGGHPAELVHEADLVILSPGVPRTVEPVVEALTRGVPVWGEIELATRYCKGRVIGITGSNGKSTVTSLIGHILRRAGIPGGTGGNLDRPFSEMLTDDEPAAIHALELSSFQLESTHSLEVDPAIVLNLSPDHMDRYGALEHYGNAKARLLDMQTTDACAILNADDAPSRMFDMHVRGRRVLVSMREELERGAFLRDDTLVLRTTYGEDVLCAASQLPLRGEHNVSNCLAAALACRVVGCSAAVITDGLLTFTGLPHRLQHVATIGGVAFYNDSKATNPASTMRALTAFEPGRVRLILGGRDKGVDWHELDWPVRRCAQRLLLVGEAAEAIRRVFSGVLPLTDCATVPEAVRTGFAGARAGDVVLLAPACASFDQYRSFEQRGEDFCKAVLALQGEEDPDA